MKLRLVSTALWLGLLRSASSLPSLPSLLLRCASAALLLGACGGAPRDIARPGAKTYPAFAFAQDAEDPTTGVILGTGAETSTLLTLRREGRVTLEVPAADRDDEDVADGGARGVVRVELGAAYARAGTEQGAAIVAGVMASGAARWQLGALIASEAAARMLGKRSEAYRWEVRVERAGHGEGAEAMLAAGLAACLTGAEVKRDVAILGQVLPDGSLGASEEMAEEVAAMAAAGKKKIGVPAGVVSAVSAASGRAVSLAQLVRAHDAEIVAVADVAEAYALLTGAALPATAPSLGDAPRLAPPVLAALEERYAAWRTRMAADWAVLLMLDNEPRLPARVAQLAEAAQRAAKQAEELRVAGAWVAALDRLAEAWAQSAAAVAAFRVVELMQDGRVEEAVTSLGEAGGRGEALAAVVRLADAAATTSGAQMSRLGQVSAALTAVALAEETEPLQARAVAELRKLTPAELGSATAAQRVAGAVAPFLSANARAKAAALAALDELGLDDGGGGAARSTAELLRALPEPIARQRWLAFVAASEDRDAGAASETSPRSPKLGPARRLLQLPDAWPAELIERRARWGEHSAPWHLLRWSAALAGRALAAQLVAEQEALAVRRDRADGSPSLLLGPGGAALPMLLAIAERHARQLAHATQLGLGAVPLSQVLALQLGRQLASRSELALQLRALSAFWRSTEIGQASLRLARATVAAP
jgi:hypothetical protein